jgi:hypothetical protein
VRRYLSAGKIAITEDGTEIDTKNSTVNAEGIAELEGSSGSLL